MIKNWWNSINQIPEVAGLEIYSHADGTRSYQLILLRKEKNKLQITLRKNWKGTLSTVKEFIPSSIPIVLSIAGKGILVKKLSDVPASDSEVLTRILPNAKPEEFYIQRLDYQKHSFIALLRREFLDSLLQELNALEYLITDVHCGALQVAALGTFLKRETTWILPPYQFEYLNGELKDYQSSVLNELTEGTVNIEGEQLLECEVSAFLAALNTFTGSGITGLKANVIETGKKEVKARHQFKIALWSVLIFFLTALMINFILFTSWSERNNELKQQTSVNASILKELEELEKESNEKKNFLTTTGWLSGSKQSFFADRIAASLPSAINLSELSLNPLDEKLSRTEKKKVFLYNLILIKGNCARATALNDWLESLKLIPEVQSVKLISYNYSDQDRKGKFELEISIKP